MYLILSINSRQTVSLIAHTPHSISDLVSLHRVALLCTSIYAAPRQVSGGEGLFVCTPGDDRRSHSQYNFFVIIVNGYAGCDSSQFPRPNDNCHLVCSLVADIIAPVGGRGFTLSALECEIGFAWRRADGLYVRVACNWAVGYVSP
jgi:hypothetical protein